MACGREDRKTATPEERAAKATTTATVIRAAHVSKAQRRQAEYDRVGGVGISMAGPGNPQQALFTGTRASKSCYC
jgi:hypothetical protein